MAVLVGFRERKHIYEAATSWAVDDNTGRLTVYADAKMVATYNIGVWDLVTFPPSSQPKPSLKTNTSINSGDAAWNATLTPSTNVDYRPGAR